MSTISDTIQQCMQLFDTTLRNSSTWMNWENNRAHRFAVEANGKLYPAKKLRSLITGVPVGLLIGGPPTNRFLESLNLKVVKIPRSPPSNPTVGIKFVQGRYYDRQSGIHDLFGGSRQSGISPSKLAPAVFLFTGENGGKFGYSDYMDELGIFSYTGEGQVGDMKITNGNKAITTHQELGKSLYLFKFYKKLGYMYLGEFTHLGYEWRTGHDRTGKNRKIVVFKLASVQNSIELEDEKDQDGTQSTTSLATLRQLALQAVKPACEVDNNLSLRVLYRRSQAVKDYVLSRSNGNCELCGKAAPFTRKDGSPYLEPHHINRLSDGGLDHPKFVAALCPACHREIHYGKLVNTKNESLRALIYKKEEAL